MDSEKISAYLDELQDIGIALVPKLILALLIAYIGFWLVRRISKLISKSFERSEISVEIASFLSSIIDGLLKIVVLGIAATVLGIKLTALLGLLAAAGFAVGLALQGFLGNFAAGLTIIFFKPYKVGDWVGVSDYFGKVHSIQIFNTILVTPNDKTLVIPNGQITDNIITNYSTQGKMRLELQVTMPYEESFPRVKTVVLSALDNATHILKEEDVLIGIESYDSHNIVLSVRPYIHPDNYWDATFEVYGLIKKAFSDNQIKAAYSEGVELGPIGQ